MMDVTVNPETDVDIDQELLEEAQSQMSDASPHEALNEGLRHLVEQRRAKRRAARDQLRRMFDEGALDFQLDEVDD